MVRTLNYSISLSFFCRFPYLLKAGGLYFKSSELKKNYHILFIVLFALLTISTPSFTQTRQKENTVIESSLIKTSSDEADALVKNTNKKIPDKENKSRGDVYGPKYSDIIVNNHTGYIVDIYVDGSYRGTIAAYDKRTTWSVPGATKLYAKTIFDDGTYYYWGPANVKTGYNYKWNLKN